MKKLVKWILSWLSDENYAGKYISTGFRTCKQVENEEELKIWKRQQKQKKR